MKDRQQIKATFAKARAYLESKEETQGVIRKEQWDYLENECEPGEPAEIEAEGFGLPFTICFNHPPIPKKGK